MRPAALLVLGCGDGESSTGSGDAGTDTDTGPPPCGVVRLKDVAEGIGGFALDGESGWDGPFLALSVSGAGDINGDGYADIVVGTKLANANGIPKSGRTYVVFGKTDTDNVELALVVQGVGGFALDGEDEYDLSGASVSGAGDVNGDGLADLVVGAPDGMGTVPMYDYSGRTYVVFGKTDTDTVYLADVAQGDGGFVVNPRNEYDGCGDSVSGAGDVNGDGLADVIVGSLGDERASVVFGKADTDEVELADLAEQDRGFVIEGAGIEDGTGHSVGGAGDVNGDGAPDVVVGAPWATPVGASEGRMEAISQKRGVSIAQCAIAVRT